jgi:hypothetical protein
MVELLLRRGQQLGLIFRSISRLYVQLYVESEIPALVGSKNDHNAEPTANPARSILVSGT